MKAIPVTDRELRKAWRELSRIWRTTPLEQRHNPHRLLLFYAVECGLKAVWLHQENKSLFGKEEIKQHGHDLHKLLKSLRNGGSLSLNQSIRLADVSETQRAGDISLLHQAWRYGMQCVNPTDEQLTQRLEDVLEWIAGELK